MRVKKYKRVKRPKVYVESAGSAEGNVNPNGAAERGSRSGSTSDTDTAVQLKVDGVERDAVRRDGTGVWSRQSSAHGVSLSLEPGDNQNANGTTNSKPADIQAPTPRTITCSDEGSLNPSPSDGDGKNEVQQPGSPTSGSTDYSVPDEHKDSSDDASTLTPGSLWFKAERVVCFLQLLALALDVDGAAWPTLFFNTWSWTWFMIDYIRWPMLVILRRVERTFSLSLGAEGHDLWFFRDLVGYGVEVCATGLATFVLFFVLQMPDYTSHKPQTAWKQRFLTHWFRASLPRYILYLSLADGSFASLVLCGAWIFPGDVVTAVAVVGGTVVATSWLLVVLFSFLVHVYLRLATKYDAEYSFMIAMVSNRPKHAEHNKRCDSCL